MNGFSWALLAFPVYLLAKGRFMYYANLLTPVETTSE